MIDTETYKYAEILWDYHHMNHSLEKSDCILVLGSHDPRVAVRAVELYFQGFAPMILFSGGNGRSTEDWDETEAEKFARIAEEMNVPKDDILIENQSTNTGENIIFSLKILRENKKNPESFIIVQKPYMERRSYATFRKILPDTKVFVTSPQISFLDYPNSLISREEVIHTMVGDLERIKIYPEKGFQIFQEIPENVSEAYKKLVALGYTSHLVRDE